MAAAGLGFEHISSVLLSGREHIGAGQSPHGAPAACSSSARHARARSKSEAPLRRPNFPRGGQSQLLKSGRDGGNLVPSPELRKLSRKEQKEPFQHISNMLPGWWWRGWGGGSRKLLPWRAHGRRQDQRWAWTEIKATEEARKGENKADVSIASKRRCLHCPLVAGCGKAQKPLENFFFPTSRCFLMFCCH